MHKLTTAAVAAILPLVSLGAHAFDKPDFPRLGGVKISAPQNYNDPAYQDELAKLDIVVLQDWPGWDKAHGMTRQQVAAALKQRNPKELVFTYVNVNELLTADTGVWSEVSKKLTAEKWWLYPAGYSGTPVVSTWGANFGITNYTMGARANSSGERYLDWYPRWANQTFFKNAPSIDGAFTDNFFWRPRVRGDWNGDGTAEGASSAAAQKIHREGMRRYTENMKTLMPGKYQLGNIDWGDPAAVATEYKGLLHGGWLERHIGETWSPEGLDVNGVLNKWGSWKLMMDQYRRVMADVAEPKLVIFMQYGDVKNFQAMRYGLASCLMDDGYFDFADHTRKYAGVPWFDEYDAKLGKAISKPPTTAWKNGVYRRDFENGVALVNPRGNGPQKVDLGGEFRRIAGKQDATVNNGQLTKEVTLKDRDGIILLRDKPVRRPQAPKLMTTSTGG